MASILERLASTKLWALVRKESIEILRNKYLVFLLLVPPIIQLLILGGALDPQVHNLSLGTVDHARTQESRDLISALTTTGIFRKNIELKDEEQLSRDLEKGKLNVAMVIPAEFSQDLNRRTPAPVQVIIDGADAYTAGIARFYSSRIIHEYKPAAENSSNIKIPIEPDIRILYNPEQVSSWYFIPGVLGACLTLTGTLVASATVLKERERGTMEQLLMTPASSLEILLAKIIPLMIALLADVCLAIGAAHLVFGLPVRGSFMLLLAASALYAFAGIGFGMLLGSVCRSQRQAQLASFFINIPLILLSGTVVPLDTMPPFLQAVSLFDPLRYYTIIVRGVILKGSTLSLMWHQMALLAVSAAIILIISANRFRRQLV